MLLCPKTHDFLEGWTFQQALPRDCGHRRYARVTRNGQNAIFMKQDEDHIVPEEMMDFIKIAKWLNNVGLKAPEIYDAHEADGMMLIEDLGTVSVKDVLLGGGDVLALYGQLMSILDHLAAQDCPLDLPLYQGSAIDEGHTQVMDWYVPALLGQNACADSDMAAYLVAWADVERDLPPCPQSFLHIDFHTENLMFLPGEQGLKQIGILDFQDAMKGPAPYDYTNILEDARYDPGESIRNGALVSRDEVFRAWYRVLGTQFHCRVIGLFVKKALAESNYNYLVHVPRLGAYIEAALEDPVLAPLKRFFRDLGVNFTKPLDLTAGS